MNNKSANLPEQISAEELNFIIIDAIQDNKGEDIKCFDLRNLEMASTDFFIVCHGNSNTQLNGIIKNIEKKVYEQTFQKACFTEGINGNSWMLLDYFSVVVHVFSKDKRAFYNIEDLWSDAIVTEHNNH